MSTTTPRWRLSVSRRWWRKRHIFSSTRDADSRSRPTSSCISAPTGSSTCSPTTTTTTAAAAAAVTAVGVPSSPAVSPAPQHPAPPSRSTSTPPPQCRSPERLTTEHGHGRSPLARTRCQASLSYDLWPLWADPVLSVRKKRTQNRQLQLGGRRLMGGQVARVRVHRYGNQLLCRLHLQRWGLVWMCLREVPKIRLSAAESCLMWNIHRWIITMTSSLWTRRSISPCQPHNTMCTILYPS